MYFYPLNDRVCFRYRGWLAGCQLTVDTSKSATSLLSQKLLAFGYTNDELTFHWAVYVLLFDCIGLCWIHVDASCAYVQFVSCSHGYFFINFLHTALPFISMANNVTTWSNFHWPLNIDIWGPYKKNVSDSKCMLDLCNVFAICSWC